MQLVTRRAFVRRRPWRWTPALLTLALALFSIACSDDVRAPTAVISAPETAALGQVVEVDGSGSSDTGGGALSFQWRFVSLPTASLATFNDTTLVNPSFVADAPGNYVVELVVSNGVTLSAPATATIAVAQCGANPPVVVGIESDPSEPGVDATVRYTAEVTDEDNTEACGLDQTFIYQWSLVGLPTDSQAELNNRQLASPWMVADTSGSYTVHLVVTDSDGLQSDRAEFTVTVAACGEAAPEVDEITADPNDPAAGETVSLAASVSDADNDEGCDAGQTFSYSWSLAAAPSSSSARIERPDLADTWFVPDVNGEYVIELVVTDSTGRSSEPATLTLEAGDCGSNAPEITELDADPEFPNTRDLVTLSATIFDADVESESCADPARFEYAWSLAAVPVGSTAQLSRSNVASPTFRPDRPGSYEVRLVVTDSRGFESEASVVIVEANECGSNPPFATLFSGPPGPVVGEVVTLRAEVEDADLDTGDSEDTCTVGDSFTYDWSLIALPPGSLSNVVSPNTPNAGFVPDVAGTYVARVEIEDAAGHPNQGEDGITVVVIVDEVPDVTAAADPLEEPNSGLALTPLTVNFSCSSSMGEEPFEYAWSFGNGATSRQQNPSFTYNLAGTYTATCVVSDANGDEGSDTVSVTAILDTAPSVSVGANPRAGVAPHDVDFTSVVVDGNLAEGDDYIYAWDFNDGGSSDEANPSYEFDDPGNWSVVLTVTDSDGDVGTALIDVAVGDDDQPAVAAEAFPQEGIEPLTVFLSANVAGGDPPLSFEWDFDYDGGTFDIDSTLRNPSHTYVVNGSYDARVLVRDADGDEDTSIVTIVVDEDTTPLGSVAVTATPEDGLSPLLVGFTCEATAGNLPFSYQWEFGDGQGSNLQNPTHVYEAGGEFEARCTVTDVTGESGVGIVTIDVEQNTAPQVVISGNPLTGRIDPDNDFGVDFSSDVVDGNGELTYAWSFGDGGTRGPATIAGDADIAAPTYSYDTAGTFQVILTVTDEDGDIGVDSLQVALAVNGFPTVVASANPQVGTGVLLGDGITSTLTVQFAADIAGGDGPLTIEWDFDDPASGEDDTSTAQNPTHTFNITADSTFEVVVLVTDADGDSDISSVEVAIAANLTPDGLVRAEATRDNVNDPVYVTPLLVNFTCDLCDPNNEDSCDAVPSNGPLAYFWEFGDGATSTVKNAAHTYTAAGEFNARCTVTDADGDTGQGSVDVEVEQDSTPEIDLSANPLTTLIDLSVEDPETEPIAFTTSVSGGNGDLIYSWDFGDGDGDDDVDSTSHAYNSAGTFLVRVTVEDADGDVGTDTVEIAVGTNAVPSVAASANPRVGVGTSNGEGPSELEVAFFADIAGGDAPLTIEWDFDDEDSGEDNTSTAQNPTHLYSFTENRVATATVTVTDADGDEASDTVDITLIADLPVGEVTAGATPTLTAGLPLTPLLVNFTCDVDGDNNDPLSYAWDFGDGALSTLQNPTHTYTAPGAGPCDSGPDTCFTAICQRPTSTATKTAGPWR